MIREDEDEEGEEEKEKGGPSIILEPTVRQWCRVADRINMYRPKSRTVKPSMAGAIDYFRDLRRCQRVFDTCVERGWSDAAELRLGVLKRRTSKYISFLSAYREVLDNYKPEKPTDAYQDILLDLLQLKHEFENVRLDLRHQLIMVDTESIAFEDQIFGPFTIELDYGRSHMSYRTIPITPNYSAEGTDISHPHVQSNHVCEGEGSEPIRRTRQDCRILDMLLTIRQVLRTYSPDSAYIRVSAWNGYRCCDCGEDLDGDDAHSCSTEDCTGDLCDDCCSYCSLCDESYCSEHMYRCTECQDRCCDDCSEHCIKCHNRVCSDCLDTDENTSGICPKCIKALEEEAHDKEKSPEILSPVPGSPGSG